MDDNTRTRIIQRSPKLPIPSGSTDTQAPTRKMDGADVNSSQGTVKLPAVPAAQDDSGRTRLHRPSPNMSSANEAVEWDPVTGWLVVIDGPGKGQAVPIKSGSNSVGRDKTQTVCINFGDDSISRESHIVITYDPHSRKFFISPGTSRNPAYVNDIPILQAYELPERYVIRLGKTKLVFCPFCGESFDWDQV